MVRLWSEEVGDARSVIEPLVRALAPGVEVAIAGDEGFRKDTVEVRVRKAGREARCIVSFEAWEAARSHPAEMKAAFRKIIKELGGRSRLPSYLLTSRGLTAEASGKDSDLLRSIAGSIEADVLAERFFKGRIPG